MTDPQIPGVDYSSGRPGGAALATAGMRFAARYLSHTESKNLTPAEAADLAAHGVSCVVVWETTANRAAAGRTAGVADATEALAQAKGCGKPDGRPIYFAVDWDADPTVVTGYFKGVASVLGLGATAAYGGYKVIKYLLDNGLISWGWQTAAWSGGKWDARAVLRQPATTTHIAGVECDHDTATAADYGQWMPGRTPALEDDMALTDADVTKVVLGLARYLGAPEGLFASLDDATTPDDSKVTWRGNAWNGVFHAGRADANTTKIIGLLGGLSSGVAALAANGGLTAEQIEAASEAGARAALAELGGALTNTPKEN